MQYQIVWGASSGSLEDKVNQLLAQGWKLKGDIQTAQTGVDTFRILQVMVRADEGGEIEAYIG